MPTGRDAKVAGLPGATDHRRVKTYFFAWNNRPYSCFFCDEEVVEYFGQSSTSLHVHHIDGDHDNEQLQDYPVHHASCHNKFHREGKLWGHNLRDSVKKGKHAEAV